MEQLVEPKLQEYQFEIGNQSWNSKGEYLELYAAFADPKLIDPGYQHPELINSRYQPLVKFWKKVCAVLAGPDIETAKRLYMDATEGRQGMVCRFFDEYNIRVVSAGMDPSRIQISAETEEDAVQNLYKMFDEIKDSCGSVYPFDVIIEDNKIDITPLRC